MSKTEYAWVIQRDDDDRTYICSSHYICFTLANADIFECESEAQAIIDEYNLQNCRTVKVKIEIAGEEDEH